ncbi:hypothetical protein Glove_284g54 [Diversispora epigaea]|uniref:Uncharacterized protein n=1 Tax=Diversispora epigaea TaxID=1348612 RepID=A0A397I132_9GLOM|nr:hypothetical protein Glove_284g54 [Diversispora epigaea]
MTEEELKMSSAFPLFRGIFTSDRIKNACSSSLEIPTTCHKKRYLDKIKLMITMRDGINRLLKECKYIPSEKRMNLIIYGWLQFVKSRTELLCHGLVRFRIYRFGLIDQCRLPSGEDEDAYCILKLLEKTRKGNEGKFASETEVELNENRFPERYGGDSYSNF